MSGPTADAASAIAAAHAAGVPVDLLEMLASALWEVVGAGGTWPDLSDAVRDRYRGRVAPLARIAQAWARRQELDSLELLQATEVWAIPQHTPVLFVLQLDGATLDQDTVAAMAARLRGITEPLAAAGSGCVILGRGSRLDMISDEGLALLGLARVAP